MTGARGPHRHRQYILTSLPSVKAEAGPLLVRATMVRGMSETTIYDGRGKARAYVADDGETIYTWQGRAVAYLVDDKIYSWRGKHLGWFVDGVMYDGGGRRIGFVGSLSPLAVSVSPVKGVKSVPSVKSVRSVARVRSVLSAGRSDLDLDAFLTS